MIGRQASSAQRPAQEAGPCHLKSETPNNPNGKLNKREGDSCALYRSVRVKIPRPEREGLRLLFGDKRKIVKAERDNRHCQVLLYVRARQDDHFCFGRFGICSGGKEIVDSGEPSFCYVCSPVCIETFASISRDLTRAGSLPTAGRSIHFPYDYCVPRTPLKNTILSEITSSTSPQFFRKPTYLSSIKNKNTL